MPRQPRSLSRHVGGWLWCGLTALALCGSLMSRASAASAWTVAIAPDPLTHQARCLLSSAPQTTADGYETTAVKLAFNGDQLLVLTESELDPSFSDLQIAVDDYAPLRSSQIERHMILVFTQELPALIQQLRDGRQVTVRLRFWPTWPATNSFPVSFSLAGFRKAHDAFSQGCQPLTSG